MDKELKELNQFLGKAMLSTYAGGGKETKPQRAGFRELECQEGKWRYRDSYSGHYQSWGQETIWLNGKPYWTQLYGGGMEPDCLNDKEMDRKCFEFLKKSLSAGEKKESFQPRGPKRLQDGDFQYECEWNGDIEKFSGYEKIFYGKRLVFTHHFLGGVFRHK